MRFDEAEFWTASDGARLALRREPARGAARAALVLVHGFGEHAGRYAHVAEWFAARGVAVFALDQRGHGRSPGPRGHVSRFAQYLADIVALRRLVAAEAPGPLLLLGHSFGGLVVLRYLETAPEGLAGAIISSPWIGTATAVPRWKELAANLLGDLLPAVPVPTRINLAHLASDPAVGRAAAADALCHQVMTPRSYREIRQAQHDVVRERDRITGPILFVLAGNDRITSLPATRALAADLAGDVTTRVYDGLYHEILNEPRRGDVLADVAPWMDRVLAEGRGGR